jgi:D-sedoheptulose 7-phosphate isomerase
MHSPSGRKIQDLDALIRLRDGWRREGKIVAFTVGRFELLHPGHLALLQQARASGDVLVVGVNGDDEVRASKGTGRPAVPASDRAAMLAALECVDAVIVVEPGASPKLIDALKPLVVISAGSSLAEQGIKPDHVQRSGGRVVSVPLVPGYSTSALITRLAPLSSQAPAIEDARLSGLADSIRVKQRLLVECGEAIVQTGALLAKTLLAGRRVLLFGNGGSAAEAQHIAAELVGRFQHERRPLPAIALTADTSALTALGNDYGFEHVFARQVRALADPGDAVIALSTSGASPNVLAGMAAARDRGCVVLGITGRRGIRLAELCDRAIIIPSDVTARIQEASLTIGHLWCEMVESEFAAGRDP